MSLSTASNKSACITFALLALTSSSASALQCSDCSSSSSAFESSTIIHKQPIHLPSLPSIDTNNSINTNNNNSNNDHSDNTASQRNASVYFFHESFDKQPIQLPTELASIIASSFSSSPSIEDESSSSSPASAPTLGQVGYYATYSNEELCSSKSAMEFEAWEESYKSLEECCEANFSWEYDACIGVHL